MKALIIVDVQNDFTPGGALAVPEGDTIVPLINTLQEQADVVIATQDWHPAGHKSFASQHAGKKPFEKIMLHGLEQTLWPDHCLQGSAGARFHPALNMNRVEAVIRKGVDPDTDSYSAFYDNGHRRRTGLAGYLRERQVDAVYLCGLAGDICVFYTARDAIREGFRTYLVKEATRSINPNDFLQATETIAGLGGTVLPGHII